MGYAGSNLSYLQTCYSSNQSSPLLINPFGGQVGIGTTPAFPLDILNSSTGTLNTILQIYNNDFTSTNRSFLRVRQQISVGSSISSYFGTGQDGNLYIISNDPSRGGDLIINSNTGAAIFVNSISANGLATSANYKLGVTGAAFIAGGNNKGIFITDNTTYASIVGLNSAISVYNPVELRASGTDYQLYLDTAGNVGVGKQPSVKLDVNGRVDATDYRFSAGGAVLQTPSSVGTSEQYGLMFNGGGVFYWGKDNSAGNSFGMGGYATILYNTANSPIVLVTSGQRRLTVEGGGNVIVAGALSKGSGSFRIKHPLQSKKDTHDLVHSFTESPQANNIYRGKVQLVNGKAEVNLDEVSTMTEGTFVALNREIHTYTSNETDWDAVRGKVEGNILSIECQNNQSNAIVYWLVIGERQDKHMYDTDWTDQNGKVIVEPLRKIEDTNVTNEKTLCHINADCNN
jgi:hypothetical protein